MAKFKITAELLIQSWTFCYIRCLRMSSHTGVTNF